MPSLGGCRAEAIYLDGTWRVVGSVGRPANAECLQDQLAVLGRSGGLLSAEDAGWVWAYPLLYPDDMVGHLVVSRDTEPESHHQFLINALAQQASVALVNARLHARERASIEREHQRTAHERAAADQLRATNVVLERTMTELTRSSAAVQRSMEIHNRLTAVASAGEGPSGIARALHELTGLPVAIEDRHGNLTAWAGPHCPDPYPKPPPVRREQALQRALDAGGLVRHRNRLIALAMQDSEVLGVVALVDPDRTAGDSEKVALEHSNTVLALELAHRRALAEVELRLRRDLVEELLAGADPQSAQDRALALGYDLARPHRVLVITNGNRRAGHEAFFHAVRRAMRATGVGSLLVTKSGAVTVLGDGDQDWEKFRVAIIAQLGPQDGCRIGVGEPCTDPPGFPRSHWQAQLALKIQVATGCPDQVTVFDDLGIYQLLSEIANLGSVEIFIHEWLGKLLDYDAAKGAQLVESLSCYLECGGNYDLTAKRLSLHRSTLRYRLRRIRDLSGHDLNNPDTRFNLHLATRAWHTAHALRQHP